MPFAIGDLTGADAHQAVEAVAQACGRVLGDDPPWSSGPPSPSRLRIRCATTLVGAARASHTHVSSNIRT